MNERVREIGARDRARRPGYDPTLRIGYVDPATLRPDRQA
jgi:hypothetical protein